jgi:hypothetical protein
MLAMSQRFIQSTGGSLVKRLRPYPFRHFAPDLSRILNSSDGHVQSTQSSYRRSHITNVLQSRNNQDRQENRRKNNNPNSPEKSVRYTTKRILELGAESKNSATNLSPQLQPLIRDKLFWKEADTALQWWSKQGTAESVEKSFQLLDALADLSMFAQPPTQSSTILHTQTLNQLVQNWMVASARQEPSLPAPTDIFSKLQEYQTSTTARTRQNLRPNLETYHLLMEATSLRPNPQTPAGYNEFIVRYLRQQGKDLQPDLKTVAHILLGWIVRGQVVSRTELEGVLALLQEFGEPAPSADPVQLFHQALFAFARGNSQSKDSRGAEKMWQILRFMEFMASECDGLELYPTADTYNLVLNAFARVGKGAQAEMILQSWVEQYSHTRASGSTKIAQPVSKSFTIVITAFGNSEENHAAEKAEGILRWQQQLNKEDGVLQGLVPLETITYNNVIRAWSWRRSDKGVDRCDQLRKEMIQDKVAPDLQTYGQSLKGIALSNLKEKGRRAVQVWREMQFQGIEPDDYAREYFEKCVELSSRTSSPRRSRNWKQKEQSTRNRRLPKSDSI